MHSRQILLLFVLYLCGTTLAENLFELSCVSDNQCEDFEHSSCINSTCICKARDSDKHVECKPKYEKLTNIIGGPCPCTQQDTTCDEKQQQCFCNADYIPSKDKRRCLAASVPLDGPCELSSQCEKNNTFTVCQHQQQRCICKEHFEAHLGGCRALLDVSCSNDKNCSSSGSSICLPELKKCACELNLVQNHNYTICQPAAAYNERCSTTPQCQQLLGVGGVCKANQCICRPKYYASSKQDNNLALNSTICAPVVPYGAYCHYDHDCHHKHQMDLEHANLTMRCLWGECHCREYHQVVDNEFCVPLPSAASQVLSFLPQILMMFATLCLLNKISY